VHLTLGILRQSQAVFYALSFFWLDGFAVPAPAQVTQAVGRLTQICQVSMSDFKETKKNVIGKFMGLFFYCYHFA
jgi:hypothetical protein